MCPLSVDANIGSVALLVSCALLGMGFSDGAGRWVLLAGRMVY